MLVSLREKSVDEANMKSNRSKLANSPKKKLKGKDVAERQDSFPVVAIERLRVASKPTRNSSCAAVGNWNGVCGDPASGP